MKKHITWLIATPLTLLLVALLTYGCNTTNHITSTTTTENISNMPDSSEWTFTANIALPQSGRTRQITGGYDVRFSRSKLIVYLPYFGKAYSGADLFSGKSPLDFTSVDFTIERTAARKGGWNISIKPKDYKEVQSLDFTFYDNGTAYLSVSMQNRSPISFNGNVEQVRS